MKNIALALATVSAAALAAGLAQAQDHRELGAHEHGVGQLDIAIEGDSIVMELHAPGADIVGFEHAAESNEDKGMVKAALAALEKPLALFELPEDAGCSVVSANAGLELEEHDDHDEDHGHDDDNDDHDDHDEDHAGHDDHDDHAAGHSEFHAEYELTCTDMKAADRMEFAYFAIFPNAQELDIQLVTGTGALRAEVNRDRDALPLGGRM
ncbi:MAG: hypothetical protein CML68_06180 [Rhodobacteraceae bacterium]|nr:hypothetical protein [Paracoccaceae bacterium]